MDSLQYEIYLQDRIREYMDVETILQNVERYFSCDEIIECYENIMNDQNIAY
jgi:hypothetical protein